MSKVRELLIGRMREIEREIAPFKAELKEIQDALAAIGGHKPTSLAKPKSRMTVGQQTQDILLRHPEGLRNNEIKALLMENFSRAITARNLSWHLSKMRRDGLVINDNNFWKLPPENETPDISVSGASDTTDDGNGNPSSNESEETSDLLS